VQSSPTLKVWEKSHQLALPGNHRTALCAWEPGVFSVAHTVGLHWPAVHSRTPANKPQTQRTRLRLLPSTIGPWKRPALKTRLRVAFRSSRAYATRRGKGRRKSQLA